MTNIGIKLKMLEVENEALRKYKKLYKQLKTENTQPKIYIGHKHDRVDQALETFIN